MEHLEHPHTTITRDTPDTLYDAILLAGIEHDNHESDLYVPDSPITRDLIAAYDRTETATRFRNQINGQWWIDVPFAYQPYWTKRGMA